MAPKLKEEKKREILDYLETNADTDRVLALAVGQLAEELSDDHYSEDDIRELVDELKLDELVETKTAKFNVAYLTSNRNVVEEKFQDVFRASTFSKFLIGFVTYFLLLDWEPFYQFVSGENNYPAQAYVSGAFFGIIGSYLLGSIVLTFYSRLQEKLPILQEHKHLVYPVVGVGIVTGGIVYLFSLYTGQDLRIAHIIGIATLSVLGGIPLGRYVTSEAKKRE